MDNWHRAEMVRNIRADIMKSLKKIYVFETSFGVAVVLAGSPEEARALLVAHEGDPNIAHAVDEPKQATLDESGVVAYFSE